MTRFSCFTFLPLLVSLNINTPVYSMSFIKYLHHATHKVPSATTHQAENQATHQAASAVLPQRPEPAEPLHTHIPPPIQHAPDAAASSVPPNITINVQLQNTNTNSVQVEQSVYMHVLQKTKTQTQQVIHGLQQYSAVHKKKLICASLLTVYAATQATLWYLQYTLDTHHTHRWWSTWQSQKSLQELYNIPQKQLAHELLHAVQSRYTLLDKPLDYATPLIQFTHDLEQEIYLLTLYKKLVATLERTKLKLLFFYNAQLIQAYTERLQRLAYLKSCFFNSLVTHKAATIAL